MQPTSVTGILILNRKQHFSQPGFTLWEVLVVLIIISVTAGVMLISFNPDRGSAQLEILGSDLSKLFRLLSQEAIFENRNFAFSLKKKGYRLLEYDGEEWQFSKHRLASKLVLNERQKSTMTVENLQVSSVGEAEMVPHILILSSGEVSPFEWKIIDSGSKSEIIISGDLTGNIQTIGPVPLS